MTNRVPYPELTALQKEAYAISASKGFHDKPAALTEQILLIHTELSEAVEELRAGRAADELYHGENNKPEGVPAELADVFIRLLDACETHDIDLGTVTLLKMAYNRTRPVKHGGKAF